MPLAMNREVFITCAVTGSGDTQDRSPQVPRSPKQIADVGDRGGQGRRRHRPLPRARPRDRQAAPRRRTSTAR